MKGLLISTAIATALMAGLFFAYSFSVVPGLGQLDDLAYLSAMQSINRAIQNTFFFIPFFAALVLPFATAWGAARANFQKVKPYLLAAGICYALGVIAVTMLGNVPLNNTLDALPLQQMSLQELQLQRDAFEGLWNRLNLVRAIASLLAVIGVALACIQYRAQKL